MAYMVPAVCPKCGKNFNQVNSAGFTPSRLCHDCEQQETDEKRKKHFEGLDKLTLEERVRVMEEWIYDYKPPHTRNPVF